MDRHTITIAYYADGEPTDGWHYYIWFRGEVAEHHGPYATRVDAFNAGHRRLSQIKRVA